MTAVIHEGDVCDTSRRKSEGINGRECLLRSICENAVDSTFHEANGLYGHLLHIALTPNYGDGEVDPDLDPVYFDAQQAGEYGVECQSLYTECNSASGLLDSFSILENDFLLILSGINLIGIATSIAGSTTAIHTKYNVPRPTCKLAII
ncbi:hypothetical protein NQ317_001984 [Molorchus minor]|uniref:Uncharacterized protein n=1 Tax=Molorchus minor TaxID=1323400 RepID=A0ABQ9JH83_9CUCU|nr:hypothetical protein NQ317_001984 [Molorchus minor]